jgi:vacuolar-type H+-ATPase subunit F/Vma7
VKFYCIGHEDTVRGFRLAGVDGQAVDTAAQAADALERVVARGDCAIIILTQRVADMIRAQVDLIRLERERPLLVEIPGPEGPLPGRKSLRELALSAVGVRVEE